MTGGKGAGIQEWLSRVRGEYWEQLGRAPEAPEAAADAWVLFRLCGRRMALEASLCRAVVRRPRAARLPGLPPWILGVAGIRGEVVSLTDPAEYLGLRSGRPAGDGFVLVVADGGVKAGLWVDGVADVAPIPPGAVVPVEAPWPGCPPGAFLGHWSGPDPEQPVLLLDGRRYLAETAAGAPDPD